ncbi:MAG: hypothetical protein ABH950_00110, partial [Candidatus Altiarchaeota archaeon]
PGAKREIVDLLEERFSAGLTKTDKAQLRAITNRGFRQHVLAESKREFVKWFLGLVHKPKEAEMILAKPTISDGKASSDLDNPFLGSLGITVIEVSQPPVKAQHTETSVYETSAVVFRGGGGQKGMAGAGLANVSAGRDTVATHTDVWSQNLRHMDLIHTFKGYVPINLMSVTE